MYFKTRSKWLVLTTVLAYGTCPASVHYAVPPPTMPRPYPIGPPMYPALVPFQGPMVAVPAGAIALMHAPKAMTTSSTTPSPPPPPPMPFPMPIPVPVPVQMPIPFPFRMAVPPLTPSPPCMMRPRPPGCPPCPPCICVPCMPAFFAYCSPCHQRCMCRQGQAPPVPLPLPAPPAVIMVPHPPGDNQPSHRAPATLELVGGSQLFLR